MTGGEGKVALITGTAGGQGRAAALLFAADGAAVAGCDVNAGGAAETVELVRAAGGRMDSTHPLDLTDEDGVRAWVDAAGLAHGGIDILYNNAGATRFSPITATSFADWSFTIRNELDIVSWPPSTPGLAWSPAAVAAWCWSARPQASPGR